MELGLDGKVALITGGSDGIGYASAWELANEGATVVICARGQEALDEAVNKISSETGGLISAIACDVTDIDQIETTFQKLIDDHGRIDILVNNAGTSSASPFDETSDDVWDYDIELKVYGAIRCSRIAVEHMKNQGGGRIVNITTPGGKAPGPSSVPTSVSRAAGIALTKAMSKDLASDNILVNTVGVGLIKSGQHRRRWEKINEQDANVSLDDFYEDMGSRVPMGRVGEAKEVGSVVAFLVSDRGSYVTGASINVDGGTSPVV